MNRSSHFLLLRDPRTRIREQDAEADLIASSKRCGEVRQTEFRDHIVRHAVRPGHKRRVLQGRLDAGRHILPEQGLLDALRRQVLDRRAAIAAVGDVLHIGEDQLARKGLAVLRLRVLLALQPLQAL